MIDKLNNLLEENKNTINNNLRVINNLLKNKTVSKLLGNSSSE